MDDSELMNVVAVGGNAVSAFLSWRLQATNACDVTLVWKSGYDHVAQYGISFKSPAFGNERFKPRHVVKSPEEAAARREGAFDYVILCIKALPDVYDLASIIDAVITPQHTCILVNTTNSLGIEAAIEERFPTNVVLSLVSKAELTQLGPSEFEHKGSTEIWVGAANNKNDRIPQTIREDMAQALAMTLSSGQVDCKVSPNIRQQQYERLIGPIAFYPASVIFETPNHAILYEKVGVKEMISGVLDELLLLAEAQGCKFPVDFKEQTIADMTKPQQTDSIMWQDYTARRPMEVETYLGSPIRIAQEARLKVPRIEALYAIMHNINTVNQTRPRGDPNNMRPASSATAGGGGGASLPPRMSSQTLGGRPMNGMPNGGPNGMPNGMGRPRPRIPSQAGPPGAGGRRPPVSMNGGPNGFARPPNGYSQSRQPSRRGSMEGADLDEFSHMVVYNEMAGGPDGAVASSDDLALREREIQLRQRELALREQEMRLRRGGPPPRRGPPQPARNGIGIYDDDDEDDDYFDSGAGPAMPMIDPDNFDMMSVTSRKNRKAPVDNTVASTAQFRKGGDRDLTTVPSKGALSGGGRFRPSFGRNRSSQLVEQAPTVHSNILEDPLMSFTSNRYANVDRGLLHAESRTNSLTASRLDEMQYGPNGPMSPSVSGAYPRRTSQSPGNPYSPMQARNGGRPSPPNGMGGMSMNGRPSPPDGMRQPVPRYPPGHGNAVAPQQVEQHAGVSTLQPPKGKMIRSLTGSASASAGSGESSHIDSEPSAHSSQSSLGPRPPVGAM